MHELAAIDSVGNHRLVDDPADADLLLFTDLHLVPWHLRDLLDHPLRREYFDRSVVYSESDRPWCAAPGVYVSMPSSCFAPAWQRAGLYLQTPTDVDPAAANPPDLLFSFVGSRSHPCRDAILDLDEPDSLLIDSTGFIFFDSADPSFESNKARFSKAIARSKFVLCPRGHGTSSFRVLEALAAGRVPVIISDEWVAPTGIAWDAFSLRVPESEAGRIGDIVRTRETDWPRLAAAAADAYQRHLAPTVMFNRLIDSCGELLETGNLGTFPKRGIRDARRRRIAASNVLGEVRSRVKRC